MNFVVISLLYYALTLPVAVLVARGWDRLIDSVWAWYPVLFLGPVAVGLGLGWSAQNNLLGKNARRLGLSVIHPMPTAWDRRFSTLRESWMIITLKDGRKVAGLMGSDSVASSDPDNRDLYLQKIYDLDGDDWIDTGDKSALIMGGEISTIEFIAIGSEPVAENTDGAASTGSDDPDVDEGKIAEPNLS